MSLARPPGQARTAGEAESRQVGDTPLLAFEALSVGYGDEPIVRDFTLTLPTGSITTIIGPNGAGKSTLLKAVFGMNRVFGGRLLFRGEAIEQLPPRGRLKRGIGFVPQGRCNFPLMTVAENLDLGAYTLRSSERPRAIERVLQMFPLLAAKRQVLAGNLSGGEQQILETAMVLEPSPQLLLLDEPSLGLSPLNQDKIFQTIADLRGHGLTVLVVEQNAHGALQVSDIGIVMELGRLFMTGPAATVLSDPRIRLAYLGASAG